LKFFDDSKYVFGMEGAYAPTRRIEIPFCSI
jgi:hypothetical protein